jgi:hypothetical protein
MKKISLPDVTLVTATGVGVEEAQEALRVSARAIDFAAIKLLAPEPPRVLAPGVEFVQIPPMSFMDYSRFMLGDLHRYVSTSHCLVIQADGFVLNAGLWRDEFLRYDYIGAPWPEGVNVSPGNWTLRLDRNRVGNGGFSLRSQKLLAASARIDFDALDFPLRSEDLVICHFLFEEMRAQGIEFAPLELAALFSLESPDPRYGDRLDRVFGFHGKHLLQEAINRVPPEFFVKQRVLSARSAPIPGEWLKAGRNDVCPCGSGKKFKRCHGALL